MSLDDIHAQEVSLVAQMDLDGRPGFKMALHEANGRIFLYLAHLFHSGWSIVDVTDPQQPELLRYIRGPANTMTKNIQVADGLMITGLEKPMPGHGPLDNPMNPDQPYEEGAYLWDITADPTTPELVGHYETGGTGTHRNFYQGGDYAYMAAWPSEFEGGILTIVDVSTPAAPEEVGKWWWPGQYHEEDATTDEPFYFHGPAYVTGVVAYLSYGRIGPVVLDISDPTDPELITRLAMGDGLGGFLGTHSIIPIPDTDRAVVLTEAIRESSPLADGDPLNYLALVDISDLSDPGFQPNSSPIGPKFLSIMPQPRPGSDSAYGNYFEKPGRFGPHNIHHPRGGGLRDTNSDMIVSTWFNAGLRIFDVSDPLAPIEAGYYVPSAPTQRVGPRPETGLVSHFEDVVVDYRKYIYCTDANAGLYIFESPLL